MHILKNTSYPLVSNGVVNVVRAEVRHKRQLPWRKKQDRDEKEIFQKTMCKLHSTKKAGRYG